MTIQGYTPTGAAAEAMHNLLLILAKSTVWQGRTGEVSTAPEDQNIALIDTNTLEGQSALPLPCALGLIDREQVFRFLAPGNNVDSYTPSGDLFLVIFIEPDPTYANKSIAEKLEAIDFFAKLLDDITGHSKQHAVRLSIRSGSFAMKESPLNVQFTNNMPRHYWATFAFEYKTAG